MTCFDEPPDAGPHGECQHEIERLEKAIAARDALLRKYTNVCTCQYDCDLCREARKLTE